MEIVCLGHVNMEFYFKRRSSPLGKIINAHLFAGEKKKRAFIIFSVGACKALPPWSITPALTSFNFLLHTSVQTFSNLAGEVSMDYEHTDYCISGPLITTSLSAAVTDGICSLFIHRSLWRGEEHMQVMGELRNMLRPKYRWKTNMFLKCERSL